MPARTTALKRETDAPGLVHPKRPTRSNQPARPHFTAHRESTANRRSGLWAPLVAE